MITDNGKYYLYRHIRLDSGQPFYIGIGTKSKDYAQYLTEYKRAFTERKRSKYWHKVAKKAGYSVEIILESDDYNFIKEKEIYFISLYKRTVDGGTLANITTGGDGTHGFSRTPEINKLIGEKTRGVNNLKSKRCYQYDSEGNFLKEWESFNMAAKALGAKKQNVLDAKNRGRSCRGFYWSDIKYDNFLKESEVYKYRLESVKNSYYIRPVVAYNDEGDVLNFESAAAAITHFTGSTKNKTNIMFALFGKYKKAYGYTFKYTGPLQKRGAC